MLGKTPELVVPSAARTASGNSGKLIGYGQDTVIRAALSVTAASGTSPTLDVVIEDTLDGGSTWFTVATFAQKTASGSEVINVDAPFSDHLRVRWTVGGTSPSFTFEVRWITY